MSCDDLFGSRHFVRRLMARACGARACGAVGARGATPCLARWPRQSLRSAAPRTSRRSARAPRAARAGSRGASGRRGTSVRRRRRTINSFAGVPARARARSGSAEKNGWSLLETRARKVCDRESGIICRARASYAAVLARRDALRRPGHRARGAPAPLVSPRRSRPRSRATRVAQGPRPAAPGSAWVWYTLRTNFLAETRALTPAHPVSMRIGPPPETAARAARGRERASARGIFPTWGVTRGRRRKRPRRFWCRWRRNQYFPKLPEDTDTPPCY